MAKQYVTKRKNGDTFYFKDAAKQILHRTDGPAVEWGNGHKAWYLNGAKHRLDGPAYEYADGVKSWYVDHIFIFAVDKGGKIESRMT